MKMFEYPLGKIDQIYDKSYRLSLLLESEEKDFEIIRSEHKKLLEQKQNIVKDLRRLDTKKLDLESYAKKRDKKVNSMLTEFRKFEDESLDQVSLFKDQP